MRRAVPFMCLVLFSFSIVFLLAGVAAEMHLSARHFLAALDGQQREAVGFGFSDQERKNWHYVPRARAGLPLKRLSGAQRKLFHSLLATALSSRGLRQAEQIMFLDQILFDMEGQNPIRDSDLYFLSIFGSPGAAETWGWRVEGHHLSLNLTLAGGRVESTTPAFFGSNPARVLGGPHAGLEVLEQEEELGLRLINSLSEGAKQKAVISEYAPGDIVTRASVRAELDSITGIAFAELSSAQAELLHRLIEIYASRFRPELASAALKQLSADGFDQVHFSWAGGFERGQGHYYRIQTPRFVIEFDNTQNDANHIHSVWREFENDFGEDPLQAHYHDPGGHHRDE